MAPYLGLSLPAIEVVERDGVGEEDKRRKMLHAWISKNGSAATFKKLIQAFEDSGDRNVAESVAGTELIFSGATCRGRVLLLMFQT